MSHEVTTQFLVQTFSRIFLEKLAAKGASAADLEPIRSVLRVTVDNLLLKMCTKRFGLIRCFHIYFEEFKMPIQFPAKIRLYTFIALIPGERCSEIRDISIVTVL